MSNPHSPARFGLILSYITPHRRVLLAVLGLLVAGSLVSLANPWMAGLLTSSVMGGGAAGSGGAQVAVSGVEVPGGGAQIPVSSEQLPGGGAQVAGSSERVSSGSAQGVVSGVQAWGGGAPAMGSRLLLGLWLGLMVVGGLLGFFTQYYIGSTGQRITAEMRARLYQHLQALPVGYYQQRRSGDTLTLLSTDAEIISGFVTDTLVQLLPALLTFGGAFVMMAWLDLTIALLAVLFLPAYFVAMKIIGRRLRPLSRAWVDANSELVSVVEENLGMLPAIKAFTREAHEQGRFERANRRLYSLSRRQLRIGAMLSPAIGLLGGLGLLVMLWVGTDHIASGQLSPGNLVSLLLYAALLMSPLRTLADVYGQVQRTRGSAERIVEFLGEQPEPTDEGDTVLSNVAGHVRFDNVHFGYPGRPRVLEDFNLDIAAGETIALTGKNGAGKSTVAHLLMRFADPDGGRILIDGVDIRAATLASVRARVGLVAQHVLLLNGTVAENIAYGEPAVAREKIEQAARAAHAHAFISELPGGYDTVIGDQGIRLSGGQRQRLSLARTLLRNPAILILDEATAMFDPAGEQAFIEECHDLLKQKTVILITHRPASLALADRVIAMPAPRAGVTGENR